MLLALACPEPPASSGSAVQQWPGLSLPQGVSTAQCTRTPWLSCCGTRWSFVFVFFFKKKKLNFILVIIFHNTSYTSDL